MLISPRARASYLVAAVGIALGCTLLPMFVANRQPDAVNLVVGLVLMLSGAELLAVRATQASGVLLLAGAVAWFVADVAPALPDVLADAAARTALVHVALIVAGVLAPRRQEAFTRFDLAALAAGVAAAVSGALGGYQVLVPVAGGALLLAGLRRVARRPGLARGRAFYTISLVLVSGALIAVPVLRGLLGAVHGPALTIGYGACLAVGGVALAMAGDWSQPTPSLDVGADGLASLDSLVAVLAGDPDARVVVRTGERGWAGLDGAEAEGPWEGSSESVRIVSRDHVPLTQEIERALALAARTIRLRDDARREGRSLERLRSRWVSVEDDERSALEARLRAGPLASLDRMESQLLTAGASPALIERLERVRRGIETLARGLDPLAGLSLQDAVASLVAEAGGSATIEPVDVDPAVARALWFACSEALANVGKHAASSKPRVSLGQADGGVVLAVTDNSRWSQETRRGGLQDLEDRLSAVGGSLSVEHGHAGSTVMVRVPSRKAPSQHVENGADAPHPRPALTSVASVPPTPEVEP